MTAIPFPFQALVVTAAALCNGLLAELAGDDEAIAKAADVASRPDGRE